MNELRKYYSDELCDVVRHCIRYQPKERPTSEQLSALIKNLEKPTKKLNEKTLSVQNWTTQRVCDWLRENQFAEYQEVFKKNDISGDVLTILQEEDLKLLVPSMGHRKKILKLISELK